MNLLSEGHRGFYSSILMKKHQEDQGTHIKIRDKDVETFKWVKDMERYPKLW